MEQRTRRTVCTRTHAFPRQKILARTFLHPVHGNRRTGGRRVPVNRIPTVTHSAFEKPAALHFHARARVLSEHVFKLNARISLVPGTRKRDVGTTEGEFSSECNLGVKTCEDPSNENVNSNVMTRHSIPHAFSLASRFLFPLRDPTKQDANDSSMESSTTTQKRSFLSRLMTESTIPERHIRRQQKRDFANGAILAVKSRRPMQGNIHLLPVPQRTPDQWDADTYESFVPYEAPALVLSKGPSVPQILMASAFAGGGSEVLLGRRHQTPFPAAFSTTKLHTVYNKFDTPMMSNTTNGNGTLLSLQWHQQHHHQHHHLLEEHETIARNHKRLGRIVVAAGTTSVLFGVKYGMTSRQASSEEGFVDHHDVCHGIVSSAAAGAARATIVYCETQLPHFRIAARGFLGNTITKPSLLFIQSDNQAARQILSREIAGAMVYFGTYETMKQALSRAPQQCETTIATKTSAAAILISGGIAGAAYRGLSYSMMHGMGPALLPVMLRAIPSHAMLFWGYESILSTTA
ncbi:hypothetical protein MHU86_1060 [Fragilaria crotonensis]|nr:hypothetical protein MHU86_1060 [Fragilaria crotonensis]